MPMVNGRMSEPATFSALHAYAPASTSSALYFLIKLKIDFFLLLNYI
jgi:hypothetical protein